MAASALETNLRSSITYSKLRVQLGFRLDSLKKSHHGKNSDDVLPLVRAYMEFYHVQDIDDARNKAFFSQFGEGSNKGCQFLYRKNGVAVAFTTIYFSYTTSITSKVAVLNDLYTLPDYRGQGMAKSLIKHCADYAKAQGAARLQWVTAPDNTQAQAVYDALDTAKSEWYFYTYAVS